MGHGKEHICRAEEGVGANPVSCGGFWSGASVGVFLWYIMQVVGLCCWVLAEGKNSLKH